MAILLSPQRRHLATRWPWLAALLALAIASPNLLWNFQHDWPSLQFYQHRSGINVPTNPLEALVMQIGGAGPAAVLVWLPGLIYLMRSPAMKAYRPLGIAFALLLFVMLLSGLRRGDRIAGAYPIVFAAGAAFIDGGSGRWVRALRWLAPALMLVLAVPTARLSLPIRPPEKIAAFFDSIGQKPSIESVEELALPIHLSARLEWQRFADQVIAAYESLPPHQRARTAILTPHWLYASVIEYYGRERNLPPVVSPHNAYYFWRGAAAGRDVVLAVAIDPEALALYFAKNTPLDVFECEYCVSWRPNLPIVLAEGAEQPLVEYLEEWRHFGLDMSPLLTIDRPPSISLLEPQNDWRHLARSGSIYGS